MVLQSFCSVNSNVSVLAVSGGSISETLTSNYIQSFVKWVYSLFHTRTIYVATYVE